MNTKFPQTPEVIADVRTIDGNGNQGYLGDKVVGVQVNVTRSKTGVVQLDIRDFRNGNLVVEIELYELVAAISMATLNADKID
jgi:hypothetical protein